MLGQAERERVIRVYIEQIAALGATAVYGGGRMISSQCTANMGDNLEKVLHLKFACGRLDMTSRKGLHSE